MRMARLAGVDIPRDKRLVIALTYIYGVGRTRSNEILTATEISPDIRVKDLSDDQLIALRDYIDASYKVEGDLRREVAADIRRKVEMAPTRASATVAGCPCTVSAPRRTRVPARARSAPSPARRRPAASNAGPEGLGENAHGTGQDRRAQAASQGKEEHRVGPGPHQVDVQQHDRLDHRPDGRRH